MDKPDKHWHFDSSVTNQAILRTFCLEVEKHYSLPCKRLCRYFAGWDDSQLLQEPPIGFGPHYRGFHCPLSGRHSLPMYLQQCFFHPLEQFTTIVPFAEMVAFDNLIYVRHSTSSDIT